MANEMSESLQLGLSYLEAVCCPSSGFQNDCVGSSRDTLEKRYFPQDNFANLIALEHLGDVLSPRVVYACRKQVCPYEPFFEEETVNSQFSATNGKGVQPLYVGVVNFSKNCKFVPDDSDCTALYHYVHLKRGMLDRKDRRLLDISRILFLNTLENGVIRPYIPPMDKGRMSAGAGDAGTIANVLKFLYFYGTEPQWFQKSEDFLFHYLSREEYMNGTRYYLAPEAFLYHVSEAVAQCPRALARFKAPLMLQMTKRIGHFLSLDHSDWYPLDFAMLIISLGALNAFNEPEFSGIGEKLFNILMGMQRKMDDEEGKKGSWPKDSYLKLGKTLTLLGGDCISTIFAVAALHRYEQQHE